MNVVIWVRFRYPQQFRSSPRLRQMMQDTIYIARASNVFGAIVWRDSRSMIDGLSPESSKANLQCSSNGISTTAPN